MWAARRRWHSVKRFVFSSTFLKCVNAALIVLFLADLRRILIVISEWKLYLERRDVSSSVPLGLNVLKWSQVDIHRPPALNDSVAEALRLNELLAGGTSEICANKSRIGGKFDGFFVCEDEGFRKQSKKAFLLTNRVTLTGEFEQSLNAERWSLFVPPQSNILDLLIADLEVKHMPSNSEGEIPVFDILNEIVGQQFFIAKVDLADVFVKDSHAQFSYDVLEKLAQKLETEQLLVAIRFEKRDSNRLYNWYRTLFSMFSRFDFVLSGAESNGFCGVDLEHFASCEYRITFIKKQKVVNRSSIEAPLFGLGSPMEEKYRLLNYLLLNKGKNKCEISRHYDQIPSPCKMPQSDKSNALEEGGNCMSMIYFRYRTLNTQADWDEMMRGLGQICAEFVLFYPHKHANEIRVPKMKKHFKLGISLKKKSEKFLFDDFQGQGAWLLDAFESLLNLAKVKSYTRNILTLDLEGGEWDVLNAILQNSTSESIICVQFRNFDQILFRLRLWLVEEAQNFRKLYSNFVKLEQECGFSKVYSIAYDISTYGVIFKRESILLR